MDKASKIYIAGSTGMVGSAIMRKLTSSGFLNIITRSSTQMDLRNQQAVNDFFSAEKPEYIFLAAAMVGGIHANNTYRAEFIYNNLAIQINIIHAAYENKVKKLLFLGSSCIYPKFAPQPLKEEYILTGPLETTNESYAIAKIAGIKMCESYRSQYGCNFISVMPTNLYGPNDSYDLNDAHVLPALLKKFHIAKVENLPFVEVWGTGTPKREFLHVDDLADACLFLMNRYDEPGTINIGTGKDISINNLALMIKGVVGYQGELRFNSGKPDGTPRKLLDVGKMSRLGWKHQIDLEAGIKEVYKEVLQWEIK